MGDDNKIKKLVPRLPFIYDDTNMNFDEQIKDYNLACFKMCQNANKGKVKGQENGIVSLSLRNFV